MLRRISILAVALVATVAVAVPSADAAAKKGKVHVCVQKHGKDKGVMRLAHSKRCHKGQKSLTLNKRGPAGAPGQQGPQGPAGQGADPDALAALQQEVAALQSQLSQVQSQLSAACAQLTTVTAQLNALGTALDGIGLGGTIPALLTLVNPGAPPGLPAFSCS